jgi:GNAT superfamily N-acetyltransferase
MVPDEYLARFTVEALTNRWLGNLAELKRMQTIVAEDDESAVIGWAGYGANQSDHPPETGELGGLYVDPDHWSGGVGGALLAEAERGLASEGYARAVLWTLAANERTRRFYENRGWRFDGATDTHDSGALVVRYVKLLPRPSS